MAEQVNLTQSLQFLFELDRNPWPYWNLYFLIICRRCYYLLFGRRKDESS